MEVQIIRNVSKQLEKIKSIIEDTNNDIDSHLRNFKQWSHHRRNTLKELQRFQNELNRIHEYGNTGRVVGNGASVLGTLASIVGFGLSFSKDLKPIGQELMKYGSVVGAVGSVTSVSATLAETGFSVKVLNEVKAALKKDFELTKALLPWFERTKELNSALEEVFGCRITDDISAIFEIIREMTSLYQSGGKLWDQVQSYLVKQVTYSCAICSVQGLDNVKWEEILCNTTYKVKQLLLAFCESSSVRKATWGISEIVQKNPLALELSDASIRILGEVPMFYTFTSIIANGVISESLYGMFKGVSFAFRVFAFVSSVKDIKEGGKSKYDEIIQKAMIYLKKELDTLESYPMLRS